MSQKINPTSIRTGIIRDWTARWVPRHFKFGASLREDYIIRGAIQKKIAIAGIDSIVIERSAGTCRITIKTAKPGLIIGRGGKGIEELHAYVKDALQKYRTRAGIKETTGIAISIEEIKRYEISSQVTAQQIAWDLEKRMPYRRTIKKYLERCVGRKN